jgi:hypothetical protein
MPSVYDFSQWNEMNPTAVFRGVSTGGFPTPGRLQEIPRLKLAWLGQLPTFKTKLDAGVTQIVQAGHNSTAEVETEARGLGLMKESITDSVMATKYKILIDIDGNANSWSGAFWKLASGTLTLKVVCDYRQWWYNLIEPWVHYVPVDCDMSNLSERIDWSLDPVNEFVVKNIIRNSLELVGSLKWDRCLGEFADMLSKDFEVRHS